MKNGEAIVGSDENKNAFRRWWEDRSKSQRKGLIFILGTALTLTILFLVYFFLVLERPKTCTTPQCQAAALEILGYLDEKQDPCNDFFRFACGTFLRNSTFDDPYTIQSVTRTMDENIRLDLIDMLEEPIDISDLPSFNLAKKFYKSCMNERAIEEQGLRKLYYLFRQMGGWPIVDGENWNSDNFDWQKAIRNLRAFGVNVDFFFNVTIEIDPMNPDKYILGIHNKFFSPSDISPNSRLAFEEYMKNVVYQFDVKSTNLEGELKEVLNFLLHLGKISEKWRKDNTTEYNRYTLLGLQKKYLSINWYEYLSGVLGNTATLSSDDVINISEPSFLQDLEETLFTTDRRVLANFMGWQMIQNLINFLPSRVLDRAYDYLGKINGRIDKAPRPMRCVEATRDRLSAPINLAYIERYFDEDLRANVSDLIRNVKIQFKKNLLLADWLDEETKRKTIQTLMSSGVKIFSPIDFFEIIEESSSYDGVEIEESKFLEAVLNLDLIFWNSYYSLLGKPVKDDWVKTQTFLSGLKVVYSATENTLKFPLGLFRGIYYNKDRPDYMNYGLLGSVLAHQISHIFVDAKAINAGDPRSTEQKLINWWSANSVRRYAEKLECLSSQYSKFNLKEVDDIHANSLITRDEDIADLSGLKVAYDTYLEKEWRFGPEPILPGLKYTAKQLFWISSALQFCSKYPVEYLSKKYSGNGYTHSPNEFRVNGPLQNLDEFAYDFGCKRGSNMNPDSKCPIW